ncbi:hypothetical protein PVAP13_8NG085804 [Panicum virgatum]|uniref:Uncharacterized protein n=1 Tax=Panicum virgatum TaxID=38727 RepID=A0A8T0P5G3_PANVG|nr:hypothetical protein PVAP13_8NG085804 [Panicum virgatum]
MPWFPRKSNGIASGTVYSGPPRVRTSCKLRRGHIRRPAYCRLLFAAARISAFLPCAHLCPIHWLLRVNYSSGNLHLSEAHFFFPAGLPYREAAHSSMCAACTGDAD